jgi:hypothetical protein
MNKCYFILSLILLISPAFALSKKSTVANCKDNALGPCYEFAGRARMYNNKDIRIWKKGSNRIYQIATQTQTALMELRHLSMATEIHGQFAVCFLKPEAPSGYSDVCVQSVKDLKTTYVPE